MIHFRTRYEEIAHVFGQRRLAVRLVTPQSASFDRGGFHVLSTPYTDHASGSKVVAMYQASELAAAFEEAGVTVVTPARMIHETLLFRSDRKSACDDRIVHARKLIRASSGLIVGLLPGYADSQELRQEIEFAQLIGRAVFYVDPDEVQLRRVN